MVVLQSSGGLQVPVCVRGQGPGRLHDWRAVRRVLGSHAPL